MSELAEDSFHRSLDAAMKSVAERVLVCIVCKGDNVSSVENAQGYLHCRCLTCGVRFWMN